MTSALLFERNQKSAEAQELLSAVMTSAYLVEKATSSNDDRNDDVLDLRGNQQMATVEWNQQKASTSSWCLELAIAKRCRSNKLARQRFAFALRFSRWFRAKYQQVQHSRETSRLDDVIISIGRSWWQQP
ncbi:hypothetical protein F511_32921 [Dorcoceras hygrometricum]|uniref:Uncharacterized protein n=1 Tax=Dorcoceras hygrometricum TaxID=472368 RepID=A0A2Z7BLS9_9LAMI|nr:hypothetical protein F511_32921 [Dorcoceras hygrometricum]